MVAADFRKLATIMFTDMVGYSALTQQDEALALELLEEHRQLLRPIFASHSGREIEAIGDGFFVEFPSALDGARCALGIQQTLADRNRTALQRRRIEVRIGLHLGDVVVRDGRVHGDGVNIAARIEPLATPGGICLSEDVARQIQNKVGHPLRRLGKGELKNIRMPVDIYRLLLPWERRHLPLAERLMFRLRQRRTHRFLVATAALLIVALVTGTYTYLKSRAPGLELPDKPSIAVLAFTNLSGDPAQEYLADGLTEDIITNLSHFRDLFVIARNSTFRYKGSPVDVQKVARELGVRYVLEGSVRRGKDRVRIAAQLIDGTTSAHVWAKTYDEPSGDLLAVQDEVTKQLVGALGVNIRETELQRSLRKPPGNVSAHDLVLRASRLWAEGSASEHLRQRDLLENAVALDPGYGRAQAMLALAYLDEHRWSYNRVPRRPDPLGSALETAERAVRLESADAFAHYALAKILFFVKQLDRFDMEVRKTLELNPNFADAMADFGIRFAHIGRLDEGASLARRAMRLNPLYPGWYHFTFLVESYVRRDYERTVAETHKINWPNSFWTYYSLAAANAQLGRMREARAAAKQLLTLYPGDFRKDSDRLLDEQNVPPATKAHWLEGLRKAGVFDALE